MKKLSLRAIKQAFKASCPNKRLLAIKINDMAISIWMDSGDASSDVEQIYYCFWSRNGDPRMLAIKDKLGVGAYSFWHSCWGHTWIRPENR